MASSDIHTTTVDRSGKFFRLVDGNVLKFTTMLDIDGNVTTNPDDCVLAVYQLPGGSFKGADLRLFEDAQWSGHVHRDIACKALNRRGRFFRLEDDNVLKFTVMLDIDCKKTDNPDDCVLAVFQLPNGLFRGVDLRMFNEHEDMQEITH
jgi:hypothetical protein